MRELGCGFPEGPAKGLLDLRDEPLGSRIAQMLQGEAEFSSHPIEKTQIHVAPRVVRLQLDCARQFLLRLTERPGLEEDQTQVRMKNRRGGVFGQEGPRGGRRLVVPASLELDDREKV